MSKVLSALNGALPDERPLLSMLIVENVAKCPAGYWPVSKTYDEDADAGLLKQNGLFGKKPSHYICLSKSEGVPGYVMDGIAVVGERESAPAGFSVAGRAGKRRICSRVSRAGAVTVTPPVTDVIVCSKMRQAPQGFVLAGEINGKVLCYKVSGCAGNLSGGDGHDYMNVVSNITPEANRSDYEFDGDEMPTSIYSMCWGGNANKYRLRPVPERPPKMSSPLISDFQNLNLKQSPAYPSIEEFTTGHDYEVLNTSYAAKPARPAPRPPSTGSPIVHGSSPNAPSPLHRHKKQPAPLPRPCNYQTLGGYSGLEGVPFLLNPKLRGLHSDEMTQLPVIKKRTLFELEQEFSYSFAVERQT